MKRKMKAGQTENSLPIFIQDTASTTGGGLSGLTSSTSGLVAEYRRRGQSTWTPITLTSKTLGTWTSGGFVADGALAGAYELDLPDVAVAVGARWVAVRLRGAANMLPCLIEIELDSVDYQTAAFGALQPTTAGRTLDVTSTGAAGIDWSNVENPTTAVDFTNTTISPTQVVDSISGVTFPTNFGVLGINSSGHLLRVVLVDTTTTNTDMRGTDNAALAINYTAGRAQYLDNLNVGGPVASQADINALNQSASRRVTLATVVQYERPETGSTGYTVEARTYDGDGNPVNADSTPTLTATGSVTGSLSGNLSAATNPATGVYRWTYTVANTATLEQVRYDLSATIAASTYTQSAFTLVTDLVSVTWTSTDAARLLAVYNKLPSRAYLTGATASTGELVPGDILNQLPSGGWVNGSFGDRILIGANSNRTVQVTGSNHAAADVHQMQPDVVTASALAADAVAEIQSGLSTLTAVDVKNEVLDALSVDVFAELSAIPGASSTLAEKISLLFMLARNKMTQTSTLQTLFADDGSTTVGTATVSDSGTTFTKGELS